MGPRGVIPARFPAKPGRAARSLRSRAARFLLKCLFHLKGPFLLKG